MRWLNICFSTLIGPRYLAEAYVKHGIIQEEDYFVVPKLIITEEDRGEFKLVESRDDPCFIKKHIFVGVNPRTQSELAAARDAIKAYMKTVPKGSPEHHAADIAQLAVKIMMNSGFGVLGQDKMFEQLISIIFGDGEVVEALLVSATVAATITRMGQESILRAQNLCLTEWDSWAVYGDTDSVFIKLSSVLYDEIWAAAEKNIPSPSSYEDEQAYALALEKAVMKQMQVVGLMMADKITTLYGDPMLMQFEKVMSRHVQQKQKKRYAAELMPAGENEGKMNASGMVSVRRDGCRLASDTVSEMLDMIVMKNDIAGATQCAIDAIQRLYEGKVSMHSLIISKRLSKPVDEYPGDPPHVVVARKMLKESPELATQELPRIEYIIREGKTRSGGKKGDIRKVTWGNLAVAPLDMLREGLKPNAQYYVENQLLKPYCTIMALVFNLTEKEVRSILFHGNHTLRRMAQTFAKEKPAAFGQFEVIAPCIVCHAPVASRSDSMCSDCMARHDAPKLHSEHVATLVQDFENAQARSHAACVVCSVCQGTPVEIGDVECGVTTCSNLWKREEAFIDIESLGHELRRLVVATDDSVLATEPPRERRRHLSVLLEEDSAQVVAEAQDADLPEYRRMVQAPLPATVTHSADTTKKRKAVFKKAQAKKPMLTQMKFSANLALKRK